MHCGNPDNLQSEMLPFLYSCEVWLRVCFISEIKFLCVPLWPTVAVSSPCNDNHSFWCSLVQFRRDASLRWRTEAAV